MQVQFICLTNVSTEATKDQLIFILKTIHKHKHATNFSNVTFEISKRAPSVC